MIAAIHLLIEKVFKYFSNNLNKLNFFQYFYTAKIPIYVK
jgi:hypothetical protein